MQDPSRTTNSTPKQVDWNKLIEQPDVVKAVAQVIKDLGDVLVKSVDHRGARNIHSIWATTAVAVGLALAIVIPVTWLTLLKIMPADAATFVYGSIAGAGFSALAGLSARGE